MAVKTIVRYHPPNELVGQRSLTVADFKRQGVFTQESDLHWNREDGFWLDADEAGIAPDMLEKLEKEPYSNDALGYFKVERQEVKDEEAAPNASEPSAEEATPSRAVRSSAGREPK